MVLDSLDEEQHAPGDLPEDIQDLAPYVLGHRLWLGPHAASHGLTVEAVIDVRPIRHFRMSTAVGVLTVIAVIAALYLARAFVVPLLIGILASYTLHPLVDWLKACRIPRSVGAALVLAVLAGSLSWIASRTGTKVRSTNTQASSAWLMM